MRRTALQYARRMFDRAIEIDPNFARAYAGIADCCSFLYMYWDSSKANLESADASSRKALELDPESAEAHTSRALALTLRRQYSEARREFETALQLNPMLFEAHYFYGRACLIEGKLEEAVSHYRDAWRVRPEDYQAIFLCSDALIGLDRRQEALEAAQQGLEVADAHLQLNPDDARAWYLSAAALMRLDQRDQALECARRAVAIDPEDPAVLYNLGCVYSLAGASNEAIDHLDRAIQNGFGQREWLENDSAFDGKLKFRTDESVLRIHDRLLAPNTPETFEQIRPDLKRLLDDMYGGAAVDFEHYASPTRLFEVQVRADESPAIGTLLSRLSSMATAPSR